MPTATEIDYTELIGQIDADPTAVTDEQLGEANTAITDRLDTLRPKVKDGSAKPDELDEVIRLGEQLERIRTVVDERDAATAEHTARAQAVLDGVPDPNAEPAEGEEGSEEGEEGEEADPDANQGADPEDVGQPEPVAAGGNRPGVGQMSGKGKAPKARTESVRARISLTAAADVAGFSAGHAMTHSDVPRALWNRLNSIRGVRGGGAGGDGEFLNVVTFNAEIPEGRQLVGGDIDGNTRKIEEVSGIQAVTAAGVCAPFSIDYSIDVVGATDEPIKDAVPAFGAERGGAQFRRDMDAAGAGPLSATGEWTLEMDEAVDDPNVDDPDPKPVWVVPCYDTVQAEVHAYTLQLEFSNMTARFDPEATRAAEQAALIAHARYCENRRLRTLLRGSKQLLVSDQISAVVDLLVAVDKTTAYLRWRRRMKSSDPIRMFLPLWVKDLLRADLARGMRTASLEAMAMADAAIERFFSARNVNITWHLDGNAAEAAGEGGQAVALQGYEEAQAGQTVPGFPDQIDIVAYPEGCWKRLDAGTLDLGVVRDSKLIEMNRYRTFTESFEGLYMKGIESLRLTASVQPTGLSAGTIDTSSLTD